MIDGNDLSAHALSAQALSAAYRTRELSPVEVTRAALDRIAAWEPKINAMYVIDEMGALAQASESEARWRDGEPLGALDGVPITIKDNIPVRGIPTPLGTAAGDMTPAAADFPALGAGTRGRLHHSRQDHDAGFRHAGVGNVEPARHHPQPVEPRPQSGRLQLGRRGRPRRRLCAARARHRHRRLGAAARRL